MKIRWIVEARGERVLYPERGLVTRLARPHPWMLEEDLRFALRSLGQPTQWKADWQLLDNRAQPVRLPHPSADRTLVELVEQTIDNVRRHPSKIPADRCASRG
jgi:hypothetical protein